MPPLRRSPTAVLDPIVTPFVHSNVTDLPHWWLVIPAAGSGTRLRLDRPKQYLDLDGRHLLAITLSRFLALPGLRGVVIALAPDDATPLDWLPDAAVPIQVARGGATRAESVINALAYLEGDPDTDAADWVMVHDAARPCVRPDDVLKLLREAPLAGGGLLAAPVRDTLKRADGEGRVTATIDREGAMHALTPQLFPLRRLREALETALAEGIAVTDESSAMEARGERPLLVEGAADNIKLTHPADLPLVRLILQAQGVIASCDGEEVGV